MKRIALLLMLSLMISMTGCSRITEEKQATEIFESFGEKGKFIDGHNAIPDPDYWIKGDPPAWDARDREYLPGEELLGDYVFGVLEPVAFLGSSVTEDAAYHVWLCMTEGGGRDRGTTVLVLVKEDPETLETYIMGTTSLLLEQYAGPAISSDAELPFEGEWTYYDGNPDKERDAFFDPLWMKASAQFAGTVYRPIALLASDSEGDRCFAFLCDGLSEGGRGENGMFIVTLKVKTDDSAVVAAVRRLDLEENGIVLLMEHNKLVIRPC